MRRPIDTDRDGSALTITRGYRNKVYAANAGRGSGHYPATSVMEIYGYDDHGDGSA